MQGKLRVTDTLDKHFKDVATDIAGFRIHRLLSHSSGLIADADVYGSPIQKDVQLRRVTATELQSTRAHNTFIRILVTACSEWSLIGIIRKQKSFSDQKRGNWHPSALVRR
jgi:hypothetical protein